MKEIKLIIAGSRNFNDYQTVKSAVMDYVKTLPNDSNITIISGGAKGVDSLGENLADEMGWQKIIVKPNWKLGRGAGPARNTAMAEIATDLIAFWDGSSRGTKDMIEKAKRHNLRVNVVQI